VKSPPPNYYIVDGTPISSSTVMLWVAPSRYSPSSPFLHTAETSC